VRIRVNLVKTFLALGLLLTLSSCGVWDFFAAYFNTYYNARTLYHQAVEEVWGMPEVRETGRNMIALVPIGTGARTKFTTVIEKCSKLLQYHPESDLVDDALLMIGRSYYFQGEYQQAERKCHELLDGYPESGLVPDTQVLLAYALYKSRDTLAAEALAMKILEAATTRGDDRIVADAAVVLGQMALDAKHTVRAREMLETVGALASEADMRAGAFLKVAELYTEEKDYVAAEKAYLRARSLSKGYAAEYRGLVGAARMVALQGEYDAALNRLQDLRGNLNYKEFFGELDVEIGHVYRDRGDISLAVNQYRYVDTAYARAESALNADYALGILYEMRFQLYDSAKVAYDRARTGPPLAKNMPIVIRKSDYLARYLLYRKDVTRLDSILAALLAPRDSLTAKEDSAVARKDSVQMDSTALARADSIRARTPAVPPMHPDTVRTRLAAAIDDLAGVLYSNMELPDSARFWYRRLIRDFPASKAAPRAFYVLARIESNDSTSSDIPPDSLYRCIVQFYPESPFADEARRLLGMPPLQKVADPAEESYVRGTRLLQAGKTKAAIDTFTVLVKRHPSSPAAVRAMYASGWLYENETQTRDSAMAIYERLVARAPSSAYAQKVQPRVQEVQTARRLALEKAKADSIAKAAPVKAAPPAPADSVKAKPVEADPEMRALEERRRAAAGTGEKPTTKTTKPRETPEEKPVD
jgi:tetratricopeptide (TPR) repeat protein